MSVRCAWRDRKVWNERSYPISLRDEFVKVSAAEDLLPNLLRSPRPRPIPTDSVGPGEGCILARFPSVSDAYCLEIWLTRRHGW